MALDDTSKLTSLQLNDCVAGNRNRLHLRENEPEPYDQVWTPCWAEYQTNFMRC